MSRYIDAEAVLEEIREVFHKTDVNGEEQMGVLKCHRIVREAPTADVVEVKKGEILLPITKEELAHLMNDTIAYIWRLEERKCDKEEFGYFSRKELLEKLKQFEKEHFPELDTNPCS